MICLRRNAVTAAGIGHFGSNLIGNGISSLKAPATIVLPGLCKHTVLFREVILWLKWTNIWRRKRDQMKGHAQDTNLLCDLSLATSSDREECLGFYRYSNISTKRRKAKKLLLRHEPKLAALNKCSGSNWALMCPQCGSRQDSKMAVNLLT